MTPHGFELFADVTIGQEPAVPAGYELQSVTGQKAGQLHCVVRKDSAELDARVASRTGFRQTGFRGRATSEILKDFVYPRKRTDAEAYLLIVPRRRRAGSHDFLLNTCIGIHDVSLA